MGLYRTHVVTPIGLVHSSLAKPSSIYGGCVTVSDIILMFRMFYTYSVSCVMSNSVGQCLYDLSTMCYML